MAKTKKGPKFRPRRKGGRRPKRRQALLNEIPPLLKGLRSGLKEIAYDQHKMARIFKDLQECHIHCLKGEAAVG